MKAEIGKTAKSVGTMIGERVRAEMNQFDDSKRERLLEEAMAIIYGKPQNVRKTANRG